MRRRIGGLNVRWVMTLPGDVVGQSAELERTGRREVTATVTAPDSTRNTSPPTETSTVSPARIRSTVSSARPPSCATRAESTQASIMSRFSSTFVWKHAPMLIFSNTIGSLAEIFCPFSAG